MSRDAAGLPMTSSVPAIPRRPSLRHILATLAFAVLISFFIDAALISVGCAFASIFVQGLSPSSGVAGIFFMILSLLVIWPFVLTPLIIVLLMDANIRRMSMWLFTASFSTIVTTAFAIFLYAMMGYSDRGLASFFQNVTILEDISIACLVSSTFAILYKTLSAYRPL